MIGQGADRGAVVQPRQDYDKFIAADPGDERLRADRFPDMVAGGDNDAVTQRMPQSIIDRL